MNLLGLARTVRCCVLTPAQRAAVFAATGVSTGRFAALGEIEAALNRVEARSAQDLRAVLAEIKARVANRIRIAAKDPRALAKLAKTLTLPKRRDLRLACAELLRRAFDSGRVDARREVRAGRRVNTGYYGDATGYYVEYGNEDQPRDSHGRWVVGYHGTTADLAEKISKEGLRPKGQFRKVFITLNRAEAIKYAEVRQAQRGWKREPVIVTIRVPKKDWEKSFKQMGLSGSRWAHSFESSAKIVCPVHRQCIRVRAHTSA